jgi:hypothetical protein
MLILTLLVAAAVPQQSPTAIGAIPSSPVCMGSNVLAARLTTLAQEDWGSLTRESVSRRWPEKLEPTGRNLDGEVTGLWRSSGKAQFCGETYVFTPRAVDPGNDPYRLTTVGIFDAEREMDRAVSSAQRLIKAIGPPEDARPPNTMAMTSTHGPEPGTVRFSAEYRWERSSPARQSETLQVDVVEQKGAFVVNLLWTREPQPERPPSDGGPTQKREAKPCPITPTPTDSKRNN